MANTTINCKIASMSHGALEAKKRETVQRLTEISLPAPQRRNKPLDSELLPVVEKIDTHHDYLGKEMQWLAADFTAERKRHLSSCRKLANAVKQYHENKEARMARELAEAELKRRRLAAKIGREVKGWWGKIEKVITYKQKLSADEARQRDMNKQLVKLVKQTESYSEALARQIDDDNGVDEGGRKRKRMTIEEALSAGLASRKSKKLLTDYTRVQLADEALYGESTASDSGSDASYEPEDEGFDDDETTFLQAEQEELLERRLMQSDDESDAESFRADPIELRQLQEEGSMDIEKVIQRLRNDGLEAKSDEELELQPATKQVKFSSPIEVRDVKPAVASCRADPGEEADDDADASDVEDFVGDGADDDEEFVADQEEADDETMIEAEERLPREISVEAEIALLQSESELPIEELLRRFSRPDGEVAADTRDFSSLQQPALHDLFYTQQVDDDQENDEEFEPDLSARDDETTMEEEEQLGREMTAEAELAILKEDSEIPLDALRAMYAGVPSSRNSSSRKCEGEDMEEEEDGDEASIAGEAAFQALEASAEKARTTLATRPFLLSPSVHLREYQQIGLNWLVSLQSRRLNGILADEMGLGKTLQTISLLAYLAANKGIWGPHLIVVPTSVILNWESELKRFCPALKVLCYYGSAKRRKELRQGWTKTNWYHVVVTSYQLAVQDAFAFKRKKWYYLVLDEAQNIKNFQSQRWQTLIHFNSQRRLLLTGTPLQNSLMELWSLLHFLMPYIFRSRKEFSFWFANPMQSMIEGADTNVDIVNRLHGIIRPFVLRRLKKDVETQMPGKFEHVIKCSLSRRQLFIYEEFMARSSTRQALRKGGNFMGMMNVLMQLRKVCNHPDLFEPRSVVTPLVLDPIQISFPSCCVGVIDGAVSRDNVCDQLLVPLWKGSAGMPSVHAALRHDQIECDQLRELDASWLWQSAERRASFRGPAESIPEWPRLPLPLRELLSRLYNEERKEKESTTRFLSSLSRERCRVRPFAYPSQLIQAVNVGGISLEGKTFDILSTPSALLAALRSEQSAAEEQRDLVNRFVFCVPKASTRSPCLLSSSASKSHVEKAATELLLEPLQDIDRPFQETQSRLTSFFPDKKLVQFDAGKLQTLAALLRELKRGGHRVLIFTQMSKMLDILEAFLNLNGHTYLRLDGSTGVDRRQRLMDRFNSDDKVFCFILSTRSGGLGVNLTGADTVVFYDSDWNPAMDAQAQDRAHRIGQTREVHIFRLVSEHTVEENILLKAQQKRNLDILVMDRGKFDASQLFGHSQNAQASGPMETKNLLTKGGLREILGADESEESAQRESKESFADQPSEEQMETAMASLEDADDVQALRGAQKEAAEELREFDETIEIQREPESDDEGGKTGKENDRTEPEERRRENDREAELESEFAAWQNTVGMDAAAIERSLAPTERYGLQFREAIDPYYSIFAVQEYRRKLESANESAQEADISQIEREKALEERRAIEDGDLLATNPEPEDLCRQRALYQRERARLKANKKRRKMTGQDWEQRIDGLSNLPFYYNVDTGEAVWDKPASLLELEAYEKAQEQKFIAMPEKPLAHIMSLLLPFPDRMNCARVCKHWHRAATDPAHVLHVYPVEMGAYTRDESKMHSNHFRTIKDALLRSLPGDTIELGDGHYWINEDVIIDHPICFVGDEEDPSNVVVEMSGKICWRARGGRCEGITFRRPLIASTALMEPEYLLRVEHDAKLDVIQSVFDASGRSATAPISETLRDCTY